jgi:hypothetical protein
LVIYDVLGRELYGLVHETKPPGEYEVTWKGDGLSSGIYFCRLSAGAYVETKKMLLMK